MTEADSNEITEVQPFFDVPVDVADAGLVAESERYDHVGRIGKGGMGEVRLVRDRKIARHIALKVLRPQLRRDPQYRSRFLFEARLQGQLDHPAIVPLYDLGEGEDGALFFSMKCVRGVTLREALQSPEKYTRRRLLTAFSSVCLAIDFAHRRGVLHRDLKPRNVMLGDFGEVYVLDWGIAKLVGARDEDTLGTPRYMAPERSLGQDSPLGDIYALGVILQEILGVDAPPELIAVAERACNDDQVRRFSSARALHEAVERFLDGDRDLEARRAQASELAVLAELALARDDRAEAGQHVGRALGLDPANAVAMRTLMQMLVNVPQSLPAGAEAEMRRRWLERRKDTAATSTISTLSMLLLVPFLFALGIHSFSLGVFAALVAAAAVTQYVSTRGDRGWLMVPSYLFTLGALAVLTDLVGLVGVVPAAFAVVVMAWRMNVDRSLHGILILLGAFVAIAAPFAGKPLDTQTIAVIGGTFGAISVALLYGRIYINELRRAERRQSFQAWQLQQLLPPATRDATPAPRG